MSAQIILASGEVCLVDDADFAELSAYKWQKSARNNGNTCGYAYRNLSAAESGHRRNASGRLAPGRISMTAHLLKPDAGLTIDHINGNTLDNRRTNLRICPFKQNNHNKRGRGGASKFKGIYKRNYGRWSAEIRVEKRRFCLGVFGTEEEAARAYDAAAQQHHGEFALLNFPDAPAERSAIFEGPGYVRRKA